MAPVVVTADRGSNTVGTASTTHLVNLPTNIAGGDLLLIYFTTDNDATHTTPSGWVVVGQWYVATTATHFTLFARDADGAEGATLTITISSSQRGSSIADRVTDAATLASSGGTTPELTSSSGSSTNPNPPAITPAGGADDYTYVAIIGADGSTTSTAGPAGYSSHLSVGAGACTSVAHKATTASTTENPGTFTRATSRWGAGTLAIYPAPAGGFTGWGIPYK